MNYVINFKPSCLHNVCPPKNRMVNTYALEMQVFVRNGIVKIFCNYGNTGTPLIGRFLGPRKNRLNRNPSY